MHVGEVMRLSYGDPNASSPRSAWLHDLFEADSRFERPVSVTVENTSNALAVLAIHELHYAEPDLVVVSVSDEGVGGGLIMEGRLRRGAHGRAMESAISVLECFLALIVIPKVRLDREDENLWTQQRLGLMAAALVVSSATSIQLRLHVDIQGEFGDGAFDQISMIDSLDLRFNRACDIFARGGSALGRALAHVSDTADPGRVVIFRLLPLRSPSLITPLDISQCNENRSCPGVRSKGSA